MTYLEKPDVDIHTEKLLQHHIENIEIQGYTIVENVLSKSECEVVSSKLDKINQEQIDDYGKENLIDLKEWGTIRALIEKDDFFEDMILHKIIFPLICRFVGDTSILHVHNGIITDSTAKHAPGVSFHRDFEKSFYSDKPLSMNAFWIIDDFTEENGGNWVVPFTHKLKNWPSAEYLNRNAVQNLGKAGSVLVFDSRLIHRGGNNKSGKPRRAINHQYTRPFIKQQIDFPSIMQNRFDLESKISQVLGFWSIPPKTVEQFRSDPDKRTYRSGQG